jgi:thiol-disulfide isomerase/thioredoxin
MLNKKIYGIALAFVFSLSLASQIFALTFDEVNASQGAKIEQVLTKSYQDRFRPQTSEEFGIPSVTFKEVKATKGVVVVFAWAKWCQPCITKIPLIKEVGSEFGTKIKLRAYDADTKDEDSPYIEKIPVAILYKDGMLVAIETVQPESMNVIKSSIRYMLKNPVLPEKSAEQFAGENNLDKIPSMGDDMYRAELAKPKLTVVYAYRPEKEHKELTNFVIKIAEKYPDVGVFRYDLTKNHSLNHDSGHKFKWDFGIIFMKDGKFIDGQVYAPYISVNLERIIDENK